MASTYFAMIALAEGGADGVADLAWGSGVSTARPFVEAAASVSTARAVKPGLFSSWRKANFKSFIVR